LFVFNQNVGVQIKFNHQSECRAFARTLFDDFIAFLKLVAPDQDYKLRCDVGVTVLSRLQRWSEYIDPSMVIYSLSYSFV
jgi:hypothetical protein